MSCRCVSLLLTDQCPPQLSTGEGRKQQQEKNQSTNINRITDFVLSDSLFARRKTDTSQFHAKQRLHILCRLSLGEVDTSDEGAFTNTVHEVRDTAEGYHVENS